MKDQNFQTRYPSYNVLDKWSSPDWDDQTREVVRKRLEEIPPIQFFTDEEAGLLDAVTQRIVPQPDRTEADVVPIVQWIDEKLYGDKRDGYRYEEMPPQRDAWRLGLKGINETAQALFEENNSSILIRFHKTWFFLMSPVAILAALRGNYCPHPDSSRTCSASPL